MEVRNNYSELLEMFIACKIESLQNKEAWDEAATCRNREAMNLIQLL